jgi:DNA ligase-1
MRNIGGVYDCSCIAWKMQSIQIDVRTCKHLCAYLGVENERARVGNDNMPTKFKHKNVTTGTTSTGVKNTPAPRTPATPVVKKSYACLLADTYENSDPTGWWISEKLDGVRAIWTGTDFRTRNNNVLHAPDWFKAALPNERLDGELWLARDEFQKTMSIVRRLNPNGEWNKIAFKVFDAPDAPGGFEARLARLRAMVLPAHVEVIPQTKCKGRDHLQEGLDWVVRQKGEGLMLRKPGSLYEKRRSSTLLKVKPFYDMEVVVTGHTPGKGKHKGVVGALTCKLNGNSFNVGGGLTDAQRRNPPGPGTTITIKYQSLTKKGIPRHASFVRVHTSV